MKFSLVIDSCTQLLEDQEIHSIGKPLNSTSDPIPLSLQTSCRLLSLVKGNKVRGKLLFERTVTSYPVIYEDIALPVSSKAIGDNTLVIGRLEI